MRQTLRNTLAWAALVAWLFASGVSADLLEVCAQANHLVKNVPVAERDHCAPCELTAAARAAADHAPVAKQDAVKAKVKPDGAVWSVRLPLATPLPSTLFREVTVSVFCPELICEVPVPPPKATV